VTKTSREPSNESHEKSEKNSIEEHQGLDADTVFEDVGELFRPDNTVIPPLNPDDPPRSDDDMAREDVAHGERPEQPVSPEHSAHQRRRINEHPVGDEQAEINRSEESPA